MGAPKIWIARQWRWPRVMLALFILEFPLTVAILTLFGVAQPNTYRTKLWKNGADQGFNSDPIEIIYAAANYRPIPVPTVWSQFLTDFNVVISVLSTFLLLVKVVVYVMHAFIPLLSLLVHALLVALYAVSIRNQSAPDMSDPKHPSPGLPWYLSKGCSYATPSNYGFCMQARATFAVAIVLLAVYVAYLVYAILNLKPTDTEVTKRRTNIELDKFEKTNTNTMTRDEQRAYNRALFLNLPKTPATPFHNPMTPRTTAFTKLSGGEQPVKVSGAGPSTKLPFREYYQGAN